MIRRLTAFLAALAALALVAPTAHANADPLVSESQWHRGSVGFNSFLASVNPWQNGPPAGPLTFRKSSATVYPRVGQRFYLHSYVADIYPTSAFDGERHRMELLLPAGLVVDIRSVNDVVCTITDSSFNYLRDMAPGECADPIRSGIMWRVPPVLLNKGETANYWIPVRATRAMTAGAADNLQMTSTMIPNRSNLLPNPVLSQLRLRVNPAVPGRPGKPTVRAYAGRKVSLAWAAAAANGAPVTYLLQRKSGTTWGTFATTRYRAWTGTVSGRKGATATFRIVARNSAGTGPASLATSVVLK